MKKKNIASFLTAMVMCANTVVCVSAEKKKEYSARAVLANSDLSVQSWGSTTISEGQNTLTFIPPKDSKGNYTSVNGIGLLAIDLEDCYFDIGTVKVDRVMVDGKQLNFNANAVVYGADDGADNYDFRIELFNSFGETANNPPFNASSVTVNEKVEVTFTFSTEGYSGGTRKIGGNVVANKKSTKPLALTGCSVKLNKCSDGSSVNCNVSGSEFSANVERGYYDVTISKSGYVTRTIKNVPAGKRLPSELKDVELRANGDVNGDGKINVTDIVVIASYIKGLRKFSDDYQFKVADCSHDNKLNVTDITMIAAAIKGKRNLT